MILFYFLSSKQYFKRKTKIFASKNGKPLINETKEIEKDKDKKNSNFFVNQSYHFVENNFKSINGKEENSFNFLDESLLYN